MRYRGHRSMQTIKDVSFVGPDDCAVASGSDDGRMFIWDRRSGARTVFPLQPYYMQPPLMGSRSLLGLSAFVTGFRLVLIGHTYSIAVIVCSRQP